MEIEDLRLMPVHKYPQYIIECCDLIDKQWPGKHAARMQGLQASCDSLPTSFALVAFTGEVVGHCKLSRIPTRPDSCFIESVVIKEEVRGRRLGTHLMSKVEEYCREFLHLSYVHLSTKDKLLFYKKHGFVECEPISILPKSENETVNAEETERKTYMMKKLLVCK